MTEQGVQQLQNKAYDAEIEFLRTLRHSRAIEAELNAAREAFEIARGNYLGARLAQKKEAGH